MQYEYKKSSQSSVSPQRLWFRRGLTATLFSILCIGTVARAADEIQVYTDDINNPGEAALELHANYVMQGRSDPIYPGELAPHHVFNLTPEFSYGVTQHFELGFYLPVAYDAGSGSGYLNGMKLRTKWLNADKPDKLYYGVNFELSDTPLHVSEERWNFEIRPIIGVEEGTWSVAFNPILGMRVSGSNQHPEFEPAIKIDRRVSPDFTLGIEHYSALGPLDKMVGANEQTHSTFLVTDFHVNGYDVNFGIGHGWRNSDEQWTIKAIIGGMPLNKH